MRFYSFLIILIILGLICSETHQTLEKEEEEESDTIVEKKVSKDSAYYYSELYKRAKEVERGFKLFWDYAKNTIGSVMNKDFGYIDYDDGDGIKKKCVCSTKYCDNCVVLK